MKIHIVKQGDSLYSIAKKYNVHLEDVVKANPEISNPDVIDVGMKVKIPSQTKPPLEVIHHHIVQQGDTLWKLSKAWGIQLTDMIKANPQLKNPNALLTGEVVNIPKTPHGSNSTEAAMQGGSVQGKVNTGMKMGTGGKANTAPVPEQVAPIVQAPAPQPAPAPAPVVVAPIAESKPIYGIEIHEHVEMYNSYKVPPVQAANQVEMPYPTYNAPSYGYGMQQPVAGAESAYPGYGYGMQQPVAGVESAYPGYGYGMQQPVAGVESAYPGYGYGMQQPVVGAESAYPGYGYGMQQPNISPETTSQKPCGCGHGHGHGHGNPQAINPLGGTIAGNMGDLYGHQDYSYSPPDDPTRVPGISTPMMMASGKTASGCKTCGGRISYQAPVNMNMGEVPYAGNYPGMGYPDGRVPYGVSPFTTGSLGNMQQAVNPAYYGMPMGDIPVGYSPVSDGFQSYYANPQNQNFYGGFPPIPPMPPMPGLRPLSEAGTDERSDPNETEILIKATTAKKRQAKPKPRLSAVRNNKPKQRESVPWIKW